jgi:pimeloyl-ACP methyl ester carboxylesterase
VVLSTSVKQRHSAKHLFWRGVVAAVGNSAMATGLYPVVPHLGMLVARRRRGSRIPPRQVRAIAGEWAVSVAMSAARPLGFFGLPGGASGPRPIIAVHGYAMNRVNFLPLARRLGRAGLGPIAGFEYWSLGKVSSAARRLGRFVDRVLDETGAEEVDLIGHSMGGIVSRYFVALGGGADRVAKLITIGSPHRGADLSGVGFGRPTKELFPGSAFLERLGAAPIPPSVRVTAIWSRSDALVPGSRNARLHGHGVEEIVFDDLGHLSLLTSRRVTRAIIERLST